VGQLAFSRENEAQADRLGVHIAYDAGYDPRGLVSMFQKFESMSPSSRKSWDLMARTHPFSIDRMNAVNEYASLLPAKPTKTTSAAFQRMKARLEALPPAPDATGQLIEASASTPTAAPPPTPAPAAPPRGIETVAYTLNGMPFKGELPADWAIRNGEAGIVFEGKKGTEAYQLTVQLEVVQKDKLPGKSLDDLVVYMHGSLVEKPDARVDAPTAHKTSEGRDARAMRARYTFKNSRGTAFAYRQMNVVIDYPEYFVSFAYYGVETLFEKYMDRFELIGQRFRYTGQ
jgi:hypothetical protein